MLTRVRELPGRIWPSLDEYLWNRARDREVRDYLRATQYLPLGGQATRGRAPHVVVIPMDGPDVASWKAGGGNFFYEIAQAAREYAGTATVSVFAVGPGEEPQVWHRRLTDYLIDTGATHVIAQVESDPNAPQSWTWDILWVQLERCWDGVFLGVLFDSAYRWITIHTRRLARTSPRFMVVDICMPMDGVLVAGRPEVGPVNMPVSNESLVEIDAYTQGMEKLFDVSFIGTLYPYRVELIDALRDRGVRVAVNPHRTDVTHDFRESRSNQPTYLDYMAGLFQSEMTINFSRSSAGDFQQLKTRVLEACAVGCLVLTDDRDRTDRFWQPDIEFGYFTDPADVPALVERFLGHTAQLKAAQAAARRRAREINVTSFWGGIDVGLYRRGLPRVLSART